MSLSASISTSIETVRGYLNALESNDPKRILAFFGPAAEVVSPTYGRKDAQAFYEKLCADTKSVVIARSEIRQSSKAHTVLANFDYQWVLQDGTVRNLEIIDVFTFENGKIKELSIYAKPKS